MQLDSLLSFLPIDRRHSLARGLPIPASAAGAVLFADISGFTPLTEALTRTLGARLGAEELTRQLNHVYDALIRQVDLLGGTITNFNGDAITCWFASGEHPLRDTARRALTCAFRMQDAMQAFAEVRLPKGETACLSLKVAIASGKVQRFLVGDPGVLRLDVLAGETLNRMAQGERHAASGEIVIDEATANVLFQTCEITEWRQHEDSTYRFAIIRSLTTAAEPAPWAELAPDALNLEHIRSWIIPALYQRADALLTELRPTVALFASFTGIDYDVDGDAEHKLDAYMRWVQSILTRYDGTLLQVTAADKGSHFYAAFGAPTAHENNAIRAASAALELRKLPIELSYIHSVRIGIAQGITRTGAYGGATRRVYSVIGDAVNLAARLMTNAPSGTILITDRVQRAVEAEFITDPLTPMQVKGRSEPLPVARLVARTEQTDAQPVRQLVGRSTELAHLLDAITPIVDGVPVGATWVYGDAGIGKTHLINAARERLGPTITWYRFPTDQLVHESLHAVMPVLHDYFSFFLAINEILKKKLFERRIDRLIRSLTDPAMIAAVSEARWYLGALMGLHWTGSPFENADPHVRFERSLTAINTLFQAESLVKPLVLHVQDAQWLDPDSRTVLELWIESASNFPLAVVIDSRELDRTVADRHALTLFPVRELDRGGVAALAAVVLNGKVSSGTVDYLLGKANGNPFFTEQIALDLHERGAISAVTGEWVMNEREIDDMPVNINAVLIARLDRLAPPVRTAVQIASVLGQEFDVAILEQMTDESEGELRLKVKQATDESIWVSQSDTLYVFRHALLRDAAYSMQLQERLRELHARAGAAIEHIHAENMTVKAPDLAYHYEKSGRHDRAVYYFIKSAQYMLSLHANHEAVGYYERALLLAQAERFPPSEIAPIYEGLGDLHEAAGAYHAAHTDYAAALRTLPADYAVWRSKLYRKQGQVLHKWGRDTEATQCYELGLLELHNDLQPEEACQLYLGLSQIHYRQGDLDEARAVALLGLSMAHQQDDKRNLAYALQTLGVIDWKLADYPQALQRYTDSLDLWQAAHSVLGLAGIHNNLGLLYQSMGDLPQAAEHLQQARAQFEQAGSLHGLACVYDNLGQVYMQSGDEAGAMDALEKAVSILAKIGLDEGQVFTGMWQAGTW